MATPAAETVRSSVASRSQARGSGAVTAPVPAAGPLLPDGVSFFDTMGEHRSISISPDRQFLLVGGTKSLFLYKINEIVSPSGGSQFSLTNLNALGSMKNIDVVRWHPQPGVNRILAASSTGTVTVYDDVVLAKGDGRYVAAQLNPSAPNPMTAVEHNFGRKVEAAQWDPHHTDWFAATHHVNCFVVCDRRVVRPVLAPPSKFIGAQTTPRDIEFSPHYEYVVSVCMDGHNENQLALFDLRRCDQPLKSVMASSALAATSFHPFISDMVVVLVRGTQNNASEIAFLDMHADWSKAGVAATPYADDLESLYGFGGISLLPAIATIAPPVCVRWRPTAPDGSSSNFLNYAMNASRRAMHPSTAPPFSTVIGVPPTTATSHDPVPQLLRPAESTRLGGAAASRSLGALLRSRYGQHLTFGTCALLPDRDVTLWDATSTYSPVAAVKSLYPTEVVRDFAWLSPWHVVCCSGDKGLYVVDLQQHAWVHHNFQPTTGISFGGFDQFSVVRDRQQVLAHTPSSQNADIELNSDGDEDDYDAIASSSAATLRTGATYHAQLQPAARQPAHSTATGSAPVTPPHHQRSETSPVGGGGGGATSPSLSRQQTYSAVPPQPPLQKQQPSPSSSLFGRVMKLVSGNKTKPSASAVSNASTASSNANLTTPTSAKPFAAGSRSPDTATAGGFPPPPSAAVHQAAAAATTGAAGSPFVGGSALVASPTHPIKNVTSDFAADFAEFMTKRREDFKGPAPNPHLSAAVKSIRLGDKNHMKHVRKMICQPATARLETTRVTTHGSESSFASWASTLPQSSLVHFAQHCACTLEIINNCVFSLRAVSDAKGHTCKANGGRENGRCKLLAPNQVDDSFAAMCAHNAKICAEVATGGHDVRSALWSSLSSTCATHDPAYIVAIVEETLDIASDYGDVQLSLVLYELTLLWAKFRAAAEEGKAEPRLLTMGHEILPLTPGECRPNWQSCQSSSIVAAVTPTSVLSVLNGTIGAFDPSEDQSELEGSWYMRSLDWLEQYTLLLEASDLFVEVKEQQIVFPVVTERVKDAVLGDRRERHMKLISNTVACGRCGSEISAVRDGRAGFARCDHCAGNAVATAAQHPHVCVVCEEPVEGGLFCWLRPCGHGGHPEHIAAWLQRATDCPKCGQALTSRSPSELGGVSAIIALAVNSSPSK